MTTDARRQLVIDELAFHASSHTHPNACLCGAWTGAGTYDEHVADAILEVLGQHADRVIPAESRAATKQRAHHADDIQPRPDTP